MEVWNNQKVFKTFFAIFSLHYILKVVNFNLHKKNNPNKGVVFTPILKLT